MITEWPATDSPSRGWARSPTGCAGVPETEVKGYLEALSARLRSSLGESLVGVYLIGSGALGDWDPASSDIDVLAVASERLSSDTRLRVVELLRHRNLPCPARGLEFVLYALEALRAPGPRIPFQINLNTGARMAEHVSFDPAGEAAHWFVIDVAIARDHAHTLVGPPPPHVIGEPSPADVRAALAASLRWHAEHEITDPNTVLNACRAWRYAAEGDWLTKREAGRWAFAQGADPDLLAAALIRAPDLDAAAARSFLTSVAAQL
jgi:hypothetical protein